MTQQRAVRPLVTLLALAALLAGMLALHCQMTGHAMHGASSTSSSSNITPHAEQHAAHHAAEAAATTVTAMAAPAVATLTAGTADGMLDCALLAMACVLLLTLVVAVSLARRPASYHRLLEAVGVALGVRRTVALPIHRPSLTLLSIRRV